MRVPSDKTLLTRAKRDLARAKKELAQAKTLLVEEAALSAGLNATIRELRVEVAQWRVRFDTLLEKCGEMPS